MFVLPKIEFSGVDVSEKNLKVVIRFSESEKNLKGEWLTDEEMMNFLKLEVSYKQTKQGGEIINESVVRKVEELITITKRVSVKTIREFTVD